MWRWSWSRQGGNGSRGVFSTYVEVILPFFKSCAFCFVVFSTYVEVIPKKVRLSKHLSSFLHVCGGDPTSSMSLFFKAEVFSTYVEVILVLCTVSISWRGFLHVCGGDPLWWFLIIIQRQFSPRMWRWSWLSLDVVISASVFSTYVEVILPELQTIYIWQCFLHVCGGDPNSSLFTDSHLTFSPRMWRWSRLVSFSKVA